ncbi:MAG TPA: hypothetical protein VM389_07640, partial [Phycisphaerae bacterium]|nr:hypothetical protein [Phycisphaerae bacterium]
MTTLHRYQGIQEILERIDSIRFRQRLLHLVRGALAVLTVAVGGLLLVTLTTGYWPGQPPTVLRWSLVGLSAAALAAAVGFYLVRWVFWRQNPAQMARRIEQALPEVRNDLINSVLLATERDQVSPELVQQA